MTTTDCTNPKHAHGGVGRILHDGECIECIREQRDTAIARAEKAEGERDEARRAGRVEAMMILMRQCPETFPGESGHKTGDAVVGSEPLADTGDYSTYWDEKKLRALFDCDGPETFLERWQRQLDGETWDRVAKESEIEWQTEQAKNALAVRDAIGLRLGEAEKQCDALAKFKAYVHDRLNSAGVPKFDDGRECRIGARLDFLLESLRADPVRRETMLAAIGLNRTFPIVRNAVALETAGKSACKHEYEQIGQQLVCVHCQDGWKEPGVETAGDET